MNPGICTVKNNNIKIQNLQCTEYHTPKTSNNKTKWLTVHRIAWYLINILTIFTVPCACLISCKVGCDLFVQRNRFGAMIMATLFNPILLCFSWATTRLRKWTRIWEKKLQNEVIREYIWAFYWCLYLWLYNLDQKMKKKFIFRTIITKNIV